MSVCLIYSDPKRIEVQFFVEEFIEPNKRNLLYISPFKGDHINPLNTGRPNAKWPQIYQIPFVPNMGPWENLPKDVLHLCNRADCQILHEINWIKLRTRKKTYPKSSGPGKQLKITDFMNPQHSPSNSVKSKLQIQGIVQAQDSHQGKSVQPENKPIQPPKQLRFSSLPVYQKDQFADEVPERIWAAWDQSHTDHIGTAPLFYLNADLFAFFNSPAICERIGWGIPRNYQPADVIKLALYFLLYGFEDPTHLYLLLDQIDLDKLKDHLAIPRTHPFPSEHHFASDLMQIGYAIGEEWFYLVRKEAEQLGLVQHVVHGLDGQFFQTWLCHPIPRRSGLPQTYGGFYNHGGAKKGFGVYQMPMVDISPHLVVPLIPHIVPANQSEQPVSWATVMMAKQAHIPASPFTVGDCGVCGTDTQDVIRDYPSVPVIPIRKNMKRHLRVTPNKKYHFSDQYVTGIPSKLLEIIYALRQAIERWHANFDLVFKIGHLHACGKEHIHMMILFAEILTMLVAITAIKIGRPDLVQMPTAFRNLIGIVQEMFPISYRQLNP